MAENSTQNAVKKTFFYHADANAVGGTIERPFNAIFPSRSSVSLPLAGGFIHRKGRAQDWKEVLSYSSVTTHVSGSKKDEANNGPWTSQVNTTIEGLNILDILTADKIVAQLSVEHPHDGTTPTVSYVGSQFINLRISGVKIEPVIKYDLFSDHDGSNEKDPAARYPKKPWPKQEKFLAKVKDQYQNAKDRFANHNDGADVPDWLSGHFSWFNSDQGFDNRDYIVCSLVDSIPELPDGMLPGTICGNSIHIQDFGKVYFGELIIDHGTHRLSMVRAQLGSPVAGALSIATASSNGRTFP
jgi:hypothetical protein